MRMIRKTRAVSKKAIEEPEEVSERTETPEVSKDAQDMLDEIECCLAEAVLDQEDEKARAKEEWYAIERDGYGFITDRVQENIWMAKYEHLFEWCCGDPIFD